MLSCLLFIFAFMWSSYAYKSNEDLIKHLEREKTLKSEEVRDVMLAVDRAHYIGQNAYVDAPQGIGNGATISAPHMHARTRLQYALELLKDFLRPGMRCLDVGCGSGYLTACMGMMVGDNGTCVGIDYIEALVEMSRRNVENDNPQLYERIGLHIGDGWKGWRDAAPFNAIHVGAAAETVPDALVEQMASPGRMVIPVGKYSQEYMVIDKDEQGVVKQRRLFGVRYVPLVKVK